MNLQANELRIGNWVLLNNNFKKVLWIKHDKVCVMNEYPSAIVDLYRIEPIQLTEEILLKCGFLKCSFTDNNYETKGMRIWKCDEMFLCDKNGVHIKNIHQLQNLYFALTGKELEINL